MVDPTPGQEALPGSLCVELPAELSRWIDDFDHNLSYVVGLAPVSRRQYCFFVRRFLAEHAAAGIPERRARFAEWLTDFVRQEAAHRLHGQSRNEPGTAMRAWLRHLVFCGAVEAELEAAIPSLPRRKHALLLVHLAVEETERVLEAALYSASAAMHDHCGRAIGTGTNQPEKAVETGTDGAVAPHAALREAAHLLRDDRNARVAAMPERT